MTAAEPTPQLLHLPGAPAGTTQWKVETLQLVNWGGFHGHSAVRFSPTTTLLSGASGTGKSTLLDAYIALVMDSNIPFNGASNDATVGRARSADQRSLVSYLRGKLDTSRDTSTGELADQVLRGRDSATWGALAVTFVDDHDRRCTLARLFYVPRAAVKDTDLTRKMCLVDGTIDLRDLEPFVEGKFDKRAVKSRFPNLTMHDSYGTFSQAFFTRLGIGAHGDGAKALRLLARIQGGQQVRTVDDLYKSMVIETPGTYPAADAAISHFKDLEDAYEAMATEEQKAEALARIPELHDERERALADARLVDTFGIHQTGDTPFELWKLTTEDALLEEVENDLRALRAETAQEKVNATNRKSGIQARKLAVEADLRANESQVTLARVEADLGRFEQDLIIVEKQREQFDLLTACLDPQVKTEADFTAAQEQARIFSDEFEQKTKEVEDRRTQIMAAAYGPTLEKDELAEELASLKDREGRMDHKLHKSRMRIAELTGIDPKNLPFAGELIDIPSEHKKWRKAVETTLFGIARILLIDVKQLDRVSRLIDREKLPWRVNFEGIDLVCYEDQRLDSRYVSGKLAFKATPFTTWVRDRVTAGNIDALCVEDAAELTGTGRRVTINGQTRHGRSGAHGELNARDVIGFSKEERLAEIAKRLGELEVILNKVHLERQANARELNSIYATARAYDHVLATSWSGINPDGIRADIERLKERKKSILDGDDTLRSLRKDLEVIEGELEAVSREIYTAEGKLEDIEKKREKAIGRKDYVVDAIQRIERAQAVTLTKEQIATLTTEFAEVATVGDLDHFHDGARRLKKRLINRGEGARTKATTAARSLEDAFQHYLGRWPDPNLSPSVENYPSFRRILDTILSTGLHERRQEWTANLNDWTGQDLVPLAGAFSLAVEDIRNRLEPVNTILATLPFGAHRYRLKIDLRELHREDVIKFKRELNVLSRAATEDFTDEQAQNWFTRLRRFMKYIRTDLPGKSNRDYFLDVRKHIEITAVSYDDQGRERSTYAALGGKSGGESQELVAFIVGAALRFQLGDEAHARPRFAPVFLDEGFVKADSEFAGRAVDAWKGLGFQLIIGAPYGQFTALEPHADHVLYMAKSPRGYSSVKALPPTTRRATRARGVEESA
ncbi:SbcC/MukB-like Walker B domain-containing protein [Amycolatopsis japonica]|uniref:ATP-binding protein n=1 Tax=Amycolatopsis japonica TaxID=208439 RepID=UPI0033306886